jgi:glycosyltransferase involved in cell wall biosynthesis
MKIIICVNSAWNLVNFRSGLIRALVSKGHTVIALAPNDKYVVNLEMLGCTFIPLPMKNGGANPFKDILLIFRFMRIFACERPNMFLGYTVKPNVYGSIAAYFWGVAVINNIAGLGSVFIQNGWLVHILRRLYRLALKNSSKVFFQNNDDRQLFIQDGLVDPNISDLLPGSGVNLDYFMPTATPIISYNNYKFRFLLIARMMRDKGIVEFVEAANFIVKSWPNSEFCLLGFLDVQNPSAITQDEINSWTASGAIKYLGVSDDVRTEISAANCIVLPSYREGTPRALLEASAMARPIITTDAVGCKEVIEDGINGYMCKSRNAQDLAEKMLKMLLLSDKERLEMGVRGRQKMEAQFSERIVIDKYLEAINCISAKRN